MRCAAIGISSRSRRSISGVMVPSASATRIDIGRGNSFDIEHGRGERFWIAIRGLPENLEHRVGQFALGLALCQACDLLGYDIDSFGYAVKTVSDRHPPLGFWNSMVCPTERPINAAPIGVRIDILFASTSASSG